MRWCAASALFFSGFWLTGQTKAPTGESPALEFTGSPLVLPYTCSDDDLQWAGLACADDPCPIYVDLSHAAGQGNLILVTGDFHAAAATIYSLLLRTDDGGRTWREPFARLCGAELDRIQMYDSQNGWISGQVMQPLALDPFFLITGDGGKSWERVTLFEEGTPGSIVQFEFDSRDHGIALVDRGGGDMRYEVHETQSGGRAWSIREKSARVPKLPAPAGSAWRVQAESKLFRLQHLDDGRWSPFASFALMAAKCREQPRAEPAEPILETEPKSEAVSEFHLGPPNEKPTKKAKP